MIFPVATSSAANNVVVPLPLVIVALAGQGAAIGQLQITLTASILALAASDRSYGPARCSHRVGSLDVSGPRAVPAIQYQNGTSAPFSLLRPIAD
jgi:hypothetical protein